MGRNHLFLELDNADYVSGNVASGGRCCYRVLPCCFRRRSVRSYTRSTVVVLVVQQEEVVTQEEVEGCKVQLRWEG